MTVSPETLSELYKLSTGLRNRREQDDTSVAGPGREGGGTQQKGEGCMDTDNSVGSAGGREE